MASATADRGPELLIVSWIFTALATIFVLLKLFTRANILHGLALDDFFIFLSVVLLIICSAIFTYDVQLGMGRHAATLAADQLEQAVRINFIANPFGIMAYSFPNISVAILMNNLLLMHGYKKWAIYGVAILQCIIAGISCILLFAQCHPTEHLWNPAIPATCLPSNVLTGFSYLVGAFSAFTDVFLAAVPILAISKLQMKLKTRIGVCILMGLTLLAAICAIVKTTYLHTLADLDDFTYGTVDLVIWVIIEASVIIMAACVPTLRPFVTFFRGNKTGRPTEGRSMFKSYALSGFEIPFFRSTRGSSVPSQLSSNPEVPDKETWPSDGSHMNGIKRTTEFSTNWDPV